MGACVQGCYNNDQNSSSPTYASNCTEMVPYLNYVDNYTATELVSSCIQRAFAPKTPYWYSWDCTNNCDQASYACAYNLSQYINFFDCQNQTGSCYYDCFVYDYSNSNNSNNSNCTNGTDQWGNCCWNGTDGYGNCCSSWDMWGNCCPNGTDNNGSCCWSGRDPWGNCCNHGQDHWGQCCTNGTDGYGNCCTSWDMWGNCCPNGTDGNGSCCWSGRDPWGTCCTHGRNNQGYCCPNGTDPWGNCYNGTYNGTWALKSKKSTPRQLGSSFQEQMPCGSCQYVSSKVQGLIEKYGCGLMFQNQVTYHCEVTFGTNTLLTEECADAFIDNCSHFESHVEKGTYNANYACSRLEAC